ncbi:protein kinase [Angomonas deanei]|nr:protein kinase [Angomonas deanei]|eukprot:EPY43309.1 protein kinase [Angomonas deanei]
MNSTRCSQCSSTEDVIFCLICRSPLCNRCCVWHCPNRADIAVCKNCTLPQLCFSCSRCEREMNYNYMEFFCEMCSNAICSDCVEFSFEQGVLKCARCCGVPVGHVTCPTSIQPYVTETMLNTLQLPLKITTIPVAGQGSSKYRKLKNRVILGEGAQGTVYKCETEDGEVVADKEIIFDDLEFSSFEQQLRQTERIMRLNHPHLIRYLDVIPGHQPFRLNVIMPYYNEGDLRNFIERQRAPIPEEKLCSIVLQIAGALQYLHNQDPPLMHLDVKPENILLLNNEEQVLLMDLDLCRTVDVSASVVKRANEPTYEYTAPEMARSTGTPKADVFSLGIVTFVLATFPDIPASENDNNEFVMLCDHSWSWDAVKRAVARDIRKIRSYKYSDSLIHLIGDMLARSPNDRPSSTEVNETG